MSVASAHRELDPASPTRESILSVLRDILSREAKLEGELREETLLLSELKLDSIQQLSLVVAVENHFAICFEPEDEASVETVGSVIDVIERRLAHHAGSAGSESEGE